MHYVLIIAALGLLGAISGCSTYSGYSNSYAPGYQIGGYGPAYMWNQTAPNGYYYYSGGRLDSGWRGHLIPEGRDHLRDR